MVHYAYFDGSLPQIPIEFQSVFAAIEFKCFFTEALLAELNSMAMIKQGDNNMFQSTVCFVDDSPRYVNSCTYIVLNEHRSLTIESLRAFSAFFLTHLCWTQ